MNLKCKPLSRIKACKESKRALKYVSIFNNPINSSQSESSEEDILDSEIHENLFIEELSKK